MRSCDLARKASRRPFNVLEPFHVPAIFFVLPDYWNPAKRLAGAASAVDDGDVVGF